MDPDQKPVDLDLQCFQIRINPGSAGQGLHLFKPVTTLLMFFVSLYCKQYRSKGAVRLGFIVFASMIKFSLKCT